MLKAAIKGTHNSQKQSVTTRLLNTKTEANKLQLEARNTLEASSESSQTATGKSQQKQVGTQLARQRSQHALDAHINILCYKCNLHICASCAVYPTDTDTPPTQVCKFFAHFTTNRNTSKDDN